MSIKLYIVYYIDRILFVTINIEWVGLFKMKQSPADIDSGAQMRDAYFRSQCVGNAKYLMWFHLFFE